MRSSMPCWWSLNAGICREKPKTPRSDKAYVRMIYAIWKDLKPFVNDHSVRSLQSFVKRQTGVDAPEYLNAELANDVIEGLKSWLGRERAKLTKTRIEAKLLRKCDAGRRGCRRLIRGGIERAAVPA